MKTIVILRQTVVTVVSLTGICALFAFPDDDSPLWWSEMVLSKAVAALCIAVVCLMFRQWGPQLDAETGV